MSLDRWPAPDDLGGTFGNVPAAASEGGREIEAEQSQAQTEPLARQSGKTRMTETAQYDSHADERQYRIACQHGKTRIPAVGLHSVGGRFSQVQTRACSLLGILGVARI